MDRPTRVCQLALLVIVAASVSCQNEPSAPPTSQKTPDTTSPAQAKLQDRQPATTQPVAANPLAGCAICHSDVADRMTGSKHLANGVGCTTCHGPSKGHVADENNNVKPDRTFTREQTESFCTQCHQCTRPTAPAPATSSPADRKVCIDCHHPH